MAKGTVAPNFYQASIRDYGMGSAQPATDSLTISQAIKLAKSHWQQQGCSLDTYRSYSDHLKEFSYWAHENLRPCTISTMNGWYAAKYREYLCSRPSKRGGHLAGSTIQHHLDTLSSFFNIMVLYGQMNNNPIQFIEGANSRHNRLQSIPKRPCPLNLDVAKQLLSLPFEGHLGLRDRVMLHFSISVCTPSQRNGGLDLDRS